MAHTPYPQTDRELMRLIERSPGHRAGYKQLIRELGLSGGRERRLLLEQLARITARGELVKVDSEQWSLPTATPEKTKRVKRGGVEMPVEHRATRDKLLAGRLDLHRDGYGFVRPNGSVDRSDDLFIPPNELNGAMQGDEVLVDEAPPGRDGRRSGRIARVLNRRNPTVVGIFHYAKTHRGGGLWESAPMINGNYITPLDERMTQAILIPEGAEIASAPKKTPHRVLGEEAVAQQSHWSEELDPHRPLEGLAVDVEITDFPTVGRPARGRIIEVLGPPDAFGVDVEIIIRKHHLPHVFPANVLAEATASAEQTVATLDTDEIRQRRDFRGLNIVTIDGETARDFDDAVLVTPLSNGNWELQVHIADVSHYVRPGTALDLEARLRGTSVYFPDRAIPMLPSQLSSGMCSLRPDEDRLVLSCVMEIDGRGEVLGYEICEGIIRSVKRMTYTQIQGVIDGNVETRSEFAELVPEFERMYELALKLNAKRHRRGSIDFDLPEPVIQFDPDGNMEAIVRSQRGWSHRLIEEFMLSANECVATWIESQGVASVYRIHEVPDPKRIVDFEETASQFGYSLGFSSLPVKRIQTKGDRRDARGTSRQTKTHEVAESIPVTPQMYQKLTAKIAGKAEERILSYLMLRSLKQARYSEKNVGHFALASPSYTHFTSPIRRYPDLIVHRLLRELIRSGVDTQGAAILSNSPQPWGEARVKGPSEKSERSVLEGPIPEAELGAIAAESSQSERRADDAERELIEWKKIKFMQDRVGEDFNAIILSCTKYGFFVELDSLFIEGLVPLTSLQDDRYMFRDTDRQIVGTRNGRVFKMGQRVHVLLDRIDRQQRRLQFALLPGEGESVLRAPRKSKTAASANGERPHSSPSRSGKKGKTKSKARERNKKSRGKRR
ncbi:VacB/RNase II family 3'-5' exoribonuclease [Tunturiibacter empetritectus]|uniref:Ribonuclease R n=1 Tax=Tunturiibacter lichenicola TaxID=2051959 RepID=A0A852VQQ2_9BACT|nr:VacB/RNase II family 3'-5' exoribonuclease [Edaphobacter lichenicola]NYF91662.1 ribonuclease R [Edaphobacter lichenicola]